MTYAYLELPQSAVLFDLRREKHGVTSLYLSLRMFLDSLSVLIFSDIPRAFVHKLRAFIGGPQAFLPKRVFQADVYFGCGCLLLFTDLNKGIYVELPATHKKQPRGCRMLQVYIYSYI